MKKRGKVRREETGERERKKRKAGSTIEYKRLRNTEAERERGGANETTYMIRNIRKRKK